MSGFSSMITLPSIARSKMPSERSFTPFLKGATYPLPTHTHSDDVQIWLKMSVQNLMNTFTETLWCHLSVSQTKMEGSQCILIIF